MLDCYLQTFIEQVLFKNENYIKHSEAPFDTQIETENWREKKKKQPRKVKKGEGNCGSSKKKAAENLTGWH